MPPWRCDHFVGFCLTHILVGYIGYVHVRPKEGLAGVAITDSEYPQRVALHLISQMLTLFMSRYSRVHWMCSSEDATYTPLPALKELLQKYQNPHEADSLLKVQKELDETKVFLNSTLSSLLERGEKLDSIVLKSEQLSTQSKAFYKVAKKTNSCCWLQ